MGLGFELAVASVYIVEIAATDMRGILGCFVQFMGSIGVLFTFIVGAFLNWYWLALVNGLCVVFFVVGMYCVPESPRWLILKGKEYSASQSLEWLRGRENALAEAAVDREIEKIKRDIAAKRKERVSLAQLKTAWKPFLVSLGMMFLLQFSALNVIVYYAVNIFQMLPIYIDPNMASIVVGLTLLVSCVVALLVVSRLSRKVMLVTSILTMGLCHIVLGVCFYLQEKSDTDCVSLALSPAASMPVEETSSELHQPISVLGWLPVVTVVIFLFMGNIGYGTLIWVVTGKTFSPRMYYVTRAFICFSFVRLKFRGRLLFLSAVTFIKRNFTTSLIRRGHSDKS